MKKILTLIAAVAMTLGANAQVISFGTKDAPAALQESFEVDGFKLTRTDTDGKHAIDANTATFGTVAEPVKFETRLKMGGKSSPKNALTLTVPSAGTLKVYVRTGSNSATDRNLILEQSGATLYNSVVQESDVKETIDNGDGTTTNVYPVITVAVVAGSINVSYPVNGLNFYGFEFVAGEGGGEQGGGEVATGDAQLIQWSEAKAKGSAAGTYGDGTFKFVATDTDASKHEIDANNAYFGTADSYMKFEYRYKVGGKSGAKNSIALTIPAKGKVLVYARTGSNSATDRNIVLTQNGTTLLDHILLESEAVAVDMGGENPTNVYPVLEANVVAGSVDVTYPINSINIYGVQFVPEGADPITGIHNVNADFNSANAALYNLAGQKVSKDYKGVVIQNGRKVVNK